MHALELNWVFSNSSWSFPNFRNWDIISKALDIIFERGEWSKYRREPLIRDHLNLYSKLVKILDISESW